MFLGKPKWLISVPGLEAEKPLLSSGLVARLRAALHSGKSRRRSEMGTSRKEGRRQELTQLPNHALWQQGIHFLKS